MTPALILLNLALLCAYRICAATKSTLQCSFGFPNKYINEFNFIGKISLYAFGWPDRHPRLSRIPDDTISGSAKGAARSWVVATNCLQKSTGYRDRLIPYGMLAPLHGSQIILERFTLQINYMFYQALKKTAAQFYHVRKMDRTNNRGQSTTN